MNAPIAKKRIAKGRIVRGVDRSPESIAALLRTMDRIGAEAQRGGLTPAKLKRILAEIKADRRRARD